MIGPHRCAWRPCRAKLRHHHRHYPTEGGGVACSPLHRDLTEAKRRARKATAILASLEKHRAETDQSPDFAPVWRH